MHSQASLKLEFKGPPPFGICLLFAQGGTNAHAEATSWACARIAHASKVNSCAQAWGKNIMNSRGCMVSDPVKLFERKLAKAAVSEEPPGYRGGEWRL